MHPNYIIIHMNASKPGSQIVHITDGKLVVEFSACKTTTQLSIFERPHDSRRIIFLFRRQRTIPFAQTGS